MPPASRLVPLRPAPHPPSLSLEAPVILARAPCTCTRAPCTLPPSSDHPPRTLVREALGLPGLPRGSCLSQATPGRPSFYQGCRSHGERKLRAQHWPFLTPSLCPVARKVLDARSFGGLSSQSGDERANDSREQEAAPRGSRPLRLGVRVPGHNQLSQAATDSTLKSQK